MLFLRLRLQQLKNDIYRGWYQVPHFFVSLGLIGASTVLVIYHHLTKLPDDQIFSRYKTRYLVIRPDDPRLDKYPLEYVTEKDIVQKFRQNQNK